MNLSRCSKLAAALVVLLLAAAVPAGAVTVSGDTPATAEVGEKQTTTFTVAEPFDDYEEWTLRGETELEDVTWQVQTFDNADNKVNEETITGQSMSYDLQASSGVVRVEVKLVGTTPSVSDWSYDPPQQFTYATFEQAQEGGASDTIQSYETQQYTSESQDARMAIDDARDAIDSAESAGVDVSGAESDFEDAVEFYNTGNFEQATSNAEEAEQAANDAASSAERTDTLLMVGAGIVVLLLLVGGVYWYFQQRDTYDKLG